MIDEMLDTTIHDMHYSNYDEATVSGAAQVQQAIKIRLLLIKGEFFANSTLGNIDFQTLANKQNIPAVIDAANKATIKSTPEVVSLTSYVSKFNLVSRTMEISFSAETTYGTINGTVTI